MAQFVSDEEGLGGSLAIYVAALAATVIALAIPVYLMSQPTHLPNPGMAAYKPPPGARVLPLARKMDAPPLATYADREDAELEALRAMARAEAEPPKPKVVARPAAVQKRDDPDERQAQYTQRSPVPFDLFGIFN